MLIPMGHSHLLQIPGNMLHSFVPVCAPQKQLHAAMLTRKIIHGDYLHR